MGLSNYGEAFARNCLRKFYANAIVPVVCNTDYEGEIKKIGDRVNVLTFLDDVVLGNYSVGSDMTTQHLADTEVSLVIDCKKYYNFDIDVVDKQFTYVDDEDSTLIENASKALEKAIDARLLDTQIESVKAGHRIGGAPWNCAIGSSATYVVITTTASVGTATFVGLRGPGAPDTTLENGWLPVDIVGKGFRICSTYVNSPWFRIYSRTSSQVLTFTAWDGNVPSSQIIPPIFPGGAEEYPASYSTDGGYGAQIEGMRSTTVTSSNVYALCVALANALDNDDIPQENRHLVVPPWFKNILVQASQLQPAIAIAYEDKVLNGRVAKVAGFDVHMVSDDRFSTDTDPIGSMGDGFSQATAYKILACHTSFCTFAHKYAESRVVTAQLQFANLYQGLNLYGFKVITPRRKAGAYLFGRA
jgi:hypothetical protein